MRILYITSEDPKAQGDYQEVSMLHGLREVLGDNCIDFPRKKIMYADFSESPKNELHGRGFSLLTEPIEDVENRDIEDIDFVLYGITDPYGGKVRSSVGSYVLNYDPILGRLAKHGVWYLDGHDHSNITKIPCFKREMYKESRSHIFPTGFGIPEHRIMPLDFDNKTQMIQKTAPPYSHFGPQILGRAARQLYVFTEEEDYYEDMHRSFFGLTCMKGGWDSLRHYEILASGACLLFRDYDKKPKPCSPQELPCFSYSSMAELEELFNRLVVDGKPTQEYIEMVCAQREWLWTVGTTKARAIKLIEVLNESKR